MSAAQGTYSRSQLLLDITQGNRIATASYPAGPQPRLGLLASGSTGAITGWGAARRRAASAPAELEPGLLASAPRAGAAYAGTAPGIDAAAAARRDGSVAVLSLGSAATLTARAEALLAPGRLVVADLPGGTGGAADLHALVAARSPGETLLAVQVLPDGAGGDLLWAGAAGLQGAAGGSLTSASTGEDGLISSVDLAPTILHSLGAPVPAAMDGREIRTAPSPTGAALRGLMRRLRVISSRRLPALAWLLAACLALVLLAWRSPRLRRRALRSAALAVLWAPVAVLLPAALEPGAGAEYAMICSACLALGALSDIALAWPRAAILPASAAVAAVTVDALAGSQLLIRSLLGPDPAGGARFHGIGNELKAPLAVLVLAAVAGALFRATHGRRAASAMACAGALLALVEGAARIGAGVGGVILVCFSFALAAAMLLPGPVDRRRAAAVILSPVAGLVALAAVDLLSAHGTGHYSGSVLHASSAAEVRDLISRRLSASRQALESGLMPLATLAALAFACWALIRRRGLLAAVSCDPGWEAALVGAVAAGILGALVEDSGPLLLVTAMGALACVLAYVGAPEPGASGKHGGEVVDADGQRHDRAARRQ